VRREIFVLTPEEKRTICFVLIAFLLGLATKHYRSVDAVTPLQAAVDQTATTSAYSAKNAESSRSRPSK
jgi:hypothetical protein